MLLAMGGSVVSPWGVEPRCSRIYAGCWAEQLRSSAYRRVVDALPHGLEAPRSLRAFAPELGFGFFEAGLCLQILHLRASDHASRIVPRDSVPAAAGAGTRGVGARAPGAGMRT